MSNNDDSTTIDIRGLESLIKALKTRRPPLARVGILGSAADQPHPGAGGKFSDQTPSTAQVGAWHEFGTTKLPVRSFLRLPLNALLGKRLETSGEFDQESMNEVIASGSLQPWVAKIAFVAEGIVIESFATEGFGTWPPSQGKGNTLVATGQLRNSISSDVGGG